MKKLFDLFGNEKIPGFKKFLRLMKLTVFFILISVFSVLAGKSYSQTKTLTLHMENVKVKEALAEIENQSKFRIMYSGKFVDVERQVSLDVKNQKIGAVLDLLFAGTDVGYTVKDRFIVLVTPELMNEGSITVSQQPAVSGKVTDESGQPLPGVTIVIKGTTQGTVTNADGEYSISSLPEDAILQFSFVGMRTQEVEVGTQTSINVEMEVDAIGIEEVVAIGFGTQKKVNLTGAVGVVDSEELQNRPVQNVQQALQGLASGVNIQQTDGRLNSTPKLNIRGVTTIGSGSSGDALVLIDGVEGELKYVNPQDIESISVLKDAAASSIYGSRAPFGVILVTTKKGKEGKTELKYSNNFRWGAPVFRLNVADSYSLATFMNDAADNANQGRYISDERLQRIKDYQNGLITTVSVPDPNNPTVWANGNSFGNANVDFYDVYYKNWAMSQEHNISASSGNENFSFYLSLGYMDKNGLLKVADDSYTRYTPTVTVEAKMTNWMKLRYTSRFIRVDYSQPTALTDANYNDLARQTWAFSPTYDDNGYYYPANSPLIPMVEGGRNNQQTNSNNHHTSLNIEPIKNWITTVDFNYNSKVFNMHTEKLKIYHHNVAGDPIVKDGESYVSERQQKTNFLNMNVFSTYNLNFDNIHNFVFMVGAQIENTKYSTFGLQRAGVIVDELTVVDLTSGLNYDGTSATPSVFGNMSECSTAGYFGRLNYNYKEKYLFEANLRYDGSSRFQKDKRWNLFPSFSAGWNMAREEFWENLSEKIDLFKLRGSYGELGNQNTSSWYPTYQVFNISANSGSWLQNGLKPNVASSPALISSSLTWEKVNTWDVGIDIGIFNHRMTSSFDYYVRKTLDMVGPAIELPNILGKSVPRSNNTDLKTYGFEFNLGWKDRLPNGLTYSGRILLWDNQTVITRYPNDTESLSTYIAGQKYGNIWGYETIGIAKSDDEMQAHLASLSEGGQNALGSNWAAGDIMYKDLNNDKKINSGSNTLDDPGDRKIIGNNTARYNFGLDFNAEWKGIDFRIFFQGVGKRDYWTSSNMFFGTSGGKWQVICLEEHLDYFRAEQSNDLAANLDAYYPRPLWSGQSKNYQTQTRYLQNAAYIRLKNISVGYTLPSTISNRFFVSKMRFYLSGENLWTGTKLAPMFDPESIDGIIGTSGSQYPLEKVLSFGLDILF